MDSPGSDEERLQQAAAGEAMLSKKMKLLIIMLSLVLIILLLPLASNHGLPLLRPMGISMLQRLWDAMRFIAMTAAISIGIISTSNSQRNNKNFDGSAHRRQSSSVHGSSTPMPSSSRESINPINMVNDINMNRSSPNNRQWQHVTGKDVNDLHPGRGKEMGNPQKLKGKEVLNDLPFAASTSFNASRDGEIYGVESPSRWAQSRWASHQGEDHDDWEQNTPLGLNKESSRRKLSAGDTWFFAPRIDEEVEEDHMIASAGHRFSSGRSRGESNISRVELQKKASSIDEKEELINKEIDTNTDKASKHGHTSSMTDEYAELRMRRAAISHLVDEFHDENRKAHRRSSSVDRRRPKYDRDEQRPDQPGLKQILMDLSKERASNVRLSNLSSGTQAYNNADQRPLKLREGSNRPQSAELSISSTTNIASAPSIQQSMKSNVQHHQSSVVSIANSLSDANPIFVKCVDAKAMGSNQAVQHKQQEEIKMGSSQILQNKADAAKMGSSQMVQIKQADVIRVGPKSHHAKMGSSQVNVQKQLDAEVGTVEIVQKQGDHQAKIASNQTLQKQADAKMGSTQTLQKANARMNSDQISQRQTWSGAKMGSGAENREDPQFADFHKANMSATSRLLMQSSKHSRSALNLEQLEQIGNSTSNVHTRPSAPLASRKKSFSYDFGDGFNPDWLMELEPPPPPGFFDQHNNMITSPSTEAAQSNYNISTPKNNASSTPVQSLVPWRSSNPIDISAYPRVPSPASPPAAFPHSTSTGPSPGEVNRRAEEFISNFNTRLIKQRQESLERQRRNG